MDVPILVSSKEVVPFIFLGAAVIAALVPVFKRFSLALALLSWVFGCYAGVVTGVAVLPALLLLLSVSIVTGQVPALTRHRNSRIIHFIAYGLFVVVCLLLGLHALPGFHNPLVVESIQFSDGSSPYTQSLNFDKAWIGFVLAYYFVNSYTVDRRSLFIAMAAIVSILLFALLIGYVRVDIKWSNNFYAWMLINLLFTCIPEEMFFRGYLQRHLSQFLGKRNLSGQAAVYIIGVVFGLAHLGGGVVFGLAATLAGIAYGYVYYRTNNILYAIGTHFLLNMVHITLFSYPHLIH